AEAEALAEESHDLSETFGFPESDTIYHTLLFFLRYDQGRLGEVVGLYVQAAASPLATPMIRAVCAITLTELGRAEEAGAVLAPIAASRFDDVALNHTWLSRMTLLAEACAGVKEPAWAETLYDRLAPSAHLVSCVLGAF